MKRLTSTAKNVLIAETNMADNSLNRENHRTEFGDENRVIRSSFTNFEKTDYKYEMLYSLSIFFNTQIMIF